jgi:4'-phosphopantetheinyl transferase
MSDCYRLWAVPLPGEAFSRGALHLWASNLDHPGHRIEAAERLLSPDERDKANRFCIDRDRRRYMISRATLRILLGSYLERPPHALCFVYGEQGKPALADQAEACAFNLSHASELAVFAIHDGGPIGIDIEHVRDFPDAEMIAQRFFAPAETQTIQSLPEVAKREAFFACWTRKEAYIKALGGGLSLPLDAFAVSCAPHLPARIEWAADDPAVGTRWFVESFRPAENYIAALVGEGARPPRYDWQAPLIA